MTQTKSGDPDPWWEVDLGDDHTIDRIVIWNRTDSSHRNRLSNFSVQVVDESRRVVLEQFVVKPPSPSLVIQQIATAQISTESVRLSPFGERNWEELGPFRVSTIAGHEKAASARQRRFARGNHDTRARLAVGYALLGETDESAKWFTQAIEEAKGPTARQAITKQLLLNEDLLTAVTQLRPNDIDLRAAAARSRIAKGNNHLQAKESSDALQEMKTARKMIDQLLSQSPEVDWSVLQPTEMLSKGGADLKVQPGGSILASGVNPDDDVYTITTTGGPEHIRAFRIEALPHPTFRNHGPGRYEYTGTFRMNELRVFVDGRPVELQSVVTNFDETDQSSDLIDGVVSERYWGNDGNQGKRSWVVVTTDLQRSSDDPLKFELVCSHGVYDRRNLGHFRISATAASEAHARTRLLGAFEMDELIDLDLTLGKAHATEGQHAESAVVVARALEKVATPERLSSILDSLTEYGEALEALAPLRPDDVKLQFSIAESHARSGRELLKDGENRPENNALEELELANETYSRLLGGANWTVLAPEELSSAAGMKLSVLPDQSIFSSAAVPAGDTYSVTIDKLPSMICGLRLETIPDPRLPGDASGWGGSIGNFGIEEFRAFLIDDEGGSRTSVPITHVTSTSANQNVASRMVDGSLKTYWAVWPLQTERQEAIFELGSAITDTAGKQLVIEVASGHDSRAQIGRFRLSAMEDARAVEAHQILHESSRANGGVDSSEGLDLDIGVAHIAQGNLDSAASAIARAFDHAKNPSNRIEVIRTLVAHDGLLEKVGELKQSDSRWSDALFRFQRSAGAREEAETALTKARGLYESQLKDTPGSRQVAAELADLLHLANGVDWKPAKPVEFTSKGGADLKVLDDQSVLASGKNPPTDTYRIALETDLTTVAAIRLDALTHESLPGEGPGRGSGGKGGGFKLSGLKVQHAPLGGDDELTEVVLSDIVADYFLRRESLSIDNWNIHPQLGMDHHAVFELQSPIENASGTKLVFTMTFHPETAWADQNLGRFRISLSDDPTAFALERDRLKTDQSTNSPMARLATEYWSLGDRERAVDTLVTAIGQTKSDSDRVLLVRDLSTFSDLLKTTFDRLGDDSQLGMAIAIYQAQSLADDGQHEAAAAVLTTGLLEHADNLEMLKLRAQVLRDQQQWSRAAEDYHHISQLTSAKAAQTATRNRASMLARAGRWDQAAELFTEQMLLSTDWDTTRNAFVCHLMAGNTDAAAVAARWLLQRVGTTANAYWSAEAVRVAITLPGVITKDNRKQVLERAGKASEGLKDLLTAAVHYRLGDLRNAAPLLDTASDKPLLQAMAAMLLREQGRTVEAAREQSTVASWFKNQGSDASDEEITDAVLASRAMIQSVYDEAAEYGLKTPRLAELNRILTEAPDDIIALVERSRLLAKEGLQRRAEVDLNRARDLAPKLRSAVEQGSDDAQHYSTLAEIAFGDQKWEDSLKLFDQAVEFGSDEAWILFRRAEIHAIRENWELAVAEWQRAFEKQPDATDQLARRLELAIDGEHWPIVAEDFSSQLDLLDKNRKGHGKRNRLLQSILLRKDPVFGELQKLRPTDTTLHIAEARDLALRERWIEAADAYAKGIIDTPDLEELYEYAAALLLAGRDEKFSAVVTQLAEQADASGELTSLFAAARAASLTEEPVLPWTEVRQWAGKANDGEKQAWFMHGAGLAAYRDGDFDQAAKWFESSSELGWHAELNNLGFCLVHAAQGDLEKSREYRELVQKWIDETSEKRTDGLMRESCTDWLELQVLLQEADQLLSQ